MNLRILATLLGLGLVFSAALGALAIYGTSKPPAPVSRTRRLVNRIWHGTAKTLREQRRHRLRLGLAAAVALIGWLLSGVLAAGLLAGLAVLGLPWLLAGARMEKASATRIEALEFWARSMRDQDDTGSGLRESILKTADKAPAAIAGEVADLAGRIRAGWDLETALRAFADDLDDHIADQVVVTLIEHTTSQGQKLGEALVAIAETAAEEVGGRQEVTKSRAKSRFELKFLLWALGGFIALGIASPQLMSAYRTVGGTILLTVLLSVIVLLLWWVRSMSMPGSEPRFLSPASKEDHQ